MATETPPVAIIMGSRSDWPTMKHAADTLDRLLNPELALFAICALVGELVPLKVHTRGSEGEVTTSTCFALALMLAGGPAVAMVGLIGGSIVADTLNGKPAKKIAFNAAQYAISVAAAPSSG